MVTVKAGETKKAGPFADPACDVWVNNSYFVNLLVTAASPKRPGPMKERATGSGVFESVALFTSNDWFR